MYCDLWPYELRPLGFKIQKRIVCAETIWGNTVNTLSKHLAWWYENSRSVIKSETFLIWLRLFIVMHVSECIFHIDHIIIIARDFYNISVSDDWNVTQHLSREKKTRIYWWFTQILQYGKIILNTYLQNISLPMLKLNYWETCTKNIRKN